MKGQSVKEKWRKENKSKLQDERRKEKRSNWELSVTAVLKSDNAQACVPLQKLWIFLTSKSVSGGLTFTHVYENS